MIWLKILYEENLAKDIYEGDDYKLLNDHKHN